MAETKRAFIEAYPKPISSVYETVVQELLVQQHFIRYKVNYQYNEVSPAEPPQDTVGLTIYASYLGMAQSVSDCHRVCKDCGNSLLPTANTFTLHLQVFALGFVSVFDQIMDGFDAEEKDAVWSAYIQALNEDPAKYRVSGGQVPVWDLSRAWFWMHGNHQELSI